MDAYSLKWAKFKRIRFLAICTPIVFLSLPALWVFLPLGNSANWLLYAIGITLIVLTFFFVWRYATWQCPRCGEPFGRFQDQCNNCSLPKWANEKQAAVDSHSQKDRQK
jgi:hypothetical protein